MEACPPYWAKEETGSSKDGGMESVSGPNPSHYYCRDYLMYVLIYCGFLKPS
jgi:hypothetical protein